MICAMRVIIITEIKISTVIQESFVKRVKFTSMKKVIMFLLLAVIMASMSAVFTSCNSFEDEAIAQMRKTIKEMAKNPDTYKITDVDVKFCNDSVCVIHTKEKGQNGMGGWSSSMSEYVYVKTTYKGEVHYIVRTRVFLVNRDFNFKLHVNPMLTLFKGICRKHVSRLIHFVIVIDDILFLFHTRKFLLVNKAFLDNH